MINDAQVFLAGYVATDPLHKLVGGRTSFASLRVAYTPRRINRETGEWSDGPTSFVTVTCWRKLADNVAMCLRKGEPVLVKGKLQVRSYDDREGNPRIAVEVDASSVGHDLARGVALFQRTRRAASETAVEMSAEMAAETAAEEAPALVAEATAALAEASGPGQDPAGSLAPGEQPGKATGAGEDQGGFPLAGDEPDRSLASRAAGDSPVAGQRPAGESPAPPPARAGQQLAGTVPDASAGAPAQAAAGASESGTTAGKAAEKPAQRAAAKQPGKSAAGSGGLDDAAVAALTGNGKAAKQ
jgi:single-strand DNA-binding protein